MKTRKQKKRAHRRHGALPQTTPRREPFEIEALEPRILLSGTWTDGGGNPLAGATEGNDTFLASNQGDVADGLGGDDTLSGDQGQDLLSGGAGHDILSGGQGSDTLDGGAGNDQLFGNQGNDVLNSGGGNDVMNGEQGDDTFRFNGVQNGDVITVDGGAANDTIDLSPYAGTNVVNNGSQITVNLGGGQSFLINHSNVENIITGNSVPVAGAGNLNVNEDATPTNVVLSGTDPDAGDAVTQYRIESLPANGELLLNGSAVHNGDVVTQAQIDGGQLTFQPGANWSGSTSFGYKAHDGDAWSDNTGTFDINVNAVNDAPTANGGSLAMNEDSASAIVTLGGADIDAGDAIDHYQIDSLPTHGVLRLSGVEVHAGDAVTQAQIDQGQLTFTPITNWNGSDSFSYRAHDGDALSTAASFNIGVSAVNDAPDAHAGADHSADALSLVTLSGGDSSDIEGDALTYAWTQVGGPSVQLSNAYAANPSFTAPDVSMPTTLVFRLDVSDGQLASSDTISVTVNPAAAQGGVPTPPSDPPVAAAPDPPPADPDPFLPPTDTAPGDNPVVDPGTPVDVVDEPPVLPPVVDSTPSGPPAVDTPAAPPVDVAPVSPPSAPPQDAPGGSWTASPSVFDAPSVRPPPMSMAMGDSNPSEEPAGPSTNPNSVPIDAPSDEVDAPAPVAESGNDESLESQAQADTPPSAGANETSASPPAQTREVHAGAVWTGDEELGILDPLRGEASVLDAADAAPDLGDGGVDGAVPVLTALEHHFDIANAVTLPSFGYGQTSGGTPPGADHLSIQEAFDELGAAEDARSWHGRYADSDDTLRASWLDDPLGKPEASLGDTLASTAGDGGGFLARLWGTVRGLGGMSSRPEDRAGDRPNRRT